MKTSRNSVRNQRFILEKKIKPWLAVRLEPAPQSGWLKAIRGALGINSRQLAERLGVTHSAILHFEKAEAAGKVSLESIRKIARAMRCQLIYAVVPEAPHANLDSVLDLQASEAARQIVTRVGHSMRLEKQGISEEDSEEQLRQLSKQLKEELSPALWGAKNQNRKSRKK
jgi:predicted DNA-binding mobile mystery protein A